MILKQFLLKFSFWFFIDVLKRRKIRRIDSIERYICIQVDEYRLSNNFATDSVLIVF